MLPNGFLPQQPWADRQGQEGMVMAVYYDRYRTEFVQEEDAKGMAESMDQKLREVVFSHAVCVGAGIQDRKEFRRMEGAFRVRLAASIAEARERKLRKLAQQEKQSRGRRTKTTRQSAGQTEQNEDEERFVALAQDPELSEAFQSMLLKSLRELQPRTVPENGMPYGSPTGLGSVSTTKQSVRRTTGAKKALVAVNAGGEIVLGHVTRQPSASGDVKGVVHAWHPPRFSERVRTKESVGSKGHAGRS
eukprot:g5635.t1